MQNYNNTLTVAIKFNTLLGPGAQVTISGLTGTQTPDRAEMPLGGVDGEPFGSAGVWTQETGTLLLTV